MNTYDYQKKGIILIFVLIAGFFLISRPVMAEEEPPTVRLVLLYTPTCEGCENLLSVLPGILDPYGSQVELIALDISQKVNEPAAGLLLESFEMENYQGPILLFSNNAKLIGAQTIQDNLASLIDHYLEQGGLEFPWEISEESQIPRISTIWIVIGIGSLLVGSYVFLKSQSRTRTQKRKRRREQDAVLKQGEQTTNQFQQLQYSREGQENREEEKSTQRDIGPLLGALIGYDKGPTDLLSKVQRILFWKDKRSGDDSIGDAYGYLAKLSKTIKKNVFLKSQSRTRTQKRKRRREQDSVPKQGEHTTNQFQQLQYSREGQENRVEEKSTQRDIGSLLGALIGYDKGPTDLLSEAQRILFWKDKRSVDDSIHDAYGYLAKLLRTITKVEGVRPLAKYHKVVSYQSAYYNCSKPVSEGDQVRVIETGWMRGDEVLKKAEVEKLSQGQGGYDG
jgi:hypothetical protein